MVKFILFVYAALVAIEIQVVFVNSFDWCSINCGGAQHTMCQYKEGTGPCTVSVSDDEKRVILDAHNRLRMGIAVGNNTGQPAASNMRVLSWDNEAALIAQRWVQTCPNGHDSCRVLQSKENLGQNQAMKGSSAELDRIKTLEEMVGMWYSEIKDMDPNAVKSHGSSSGGGVTGHYTQVVWAKTYRVGCGLGTRKGAMNEYYLICNYYPAGNFLSLPVYLEGGACTKCPDGTQCSKTWPGLCSTDKDDAGGIPPPSPSSSSILNNKPFTVLMYCLYLYFS